MSYIKYNVYVSEGQKKKIRNSYTDNEGVAIRFSYQDLLAGNDVIAITNTLYPCINKAMGNGKGSKIKMAPVQVKANLKMEGGF